MLMIQTDNERLFICSTDNWSEVKFIRTKVPVTSRSYGEGSTFATVSLICFIRSFNLVDSKYGERIKSRAMV